MKRPLGSILASIAVGLLRLLRNGNALQLIREDFRWMKISFSQCAEDLIVLNRCRQLGLKTGTFVDVGAYDPVKLSNTFLRSQRGWRGLNIDLTEAKLSEFRSCSRKYVFRLSGHPRNCHYTALAVGIGTSR